MRVSSLTDAKNCVLYKTNAHGNEIDISKVDVQGLHCGSGAHLLTGWINTDINPLFTIPRLNWSAGSLIELKGDLQLYESAPEIRGHRYIFEHNEPAYFIEHDATKRFPFPDNAFKWIFSEHFIEHIPEDAAVLWLKEMRRLLAPGGVLRISTPSLEAFVRGYLEPSADFYNQHYKMLKQISIAARPTRAFVLNQIFNWWSHKFIYDFDEICLVATDAGFSRSQINQVDFGKGKCPELAALDSQGHRDSSLYVEIYN